MAFNRIPTAKINVDGLDATEKIIEFAQNPKHKGQLRADVDYLECELGVKKKAGLMRFV